MFVGNLWEIWGSGLDMQRDNCKWGQEWEEEDVQLAAKAERGFVTQ